ncbi:MAG: PAS domain S-box protein, partial [Spirochaetia bacterium]|nr:PAS domain S-box protein [Spirochaetia bacterium]
MLRHSAAAKITLAYAAFGAAWILGGDRLAAALSADFTAFAEIQTYKGLIYVAASAALVYWVAHFQMTARDRRVAELAVHQSTQLFKTAFHSNPVGMSIVKISDGSNLEVNDALTSLLGYSREEWEAMKAPLPWDNVSVFEEFKQRLLLHGRVDRYAASMVSKSGPLRLMELSAELITLRDEPCYLSVWVDATDRLRAEVAAIEGAMRYHAVVDNSPDGFCVLDKTGRILEVNDVYVEKSGYTREELLSMSLTDLQVSDSPADEARRRESVLSGETDLFETAHRTKDGSSWPVQVNTFYSLAHGGRFLVFLHDLSHRKKAQSA